MISHGSRPCWPAYLATLDEQSASGYRACGHAETAVNILERQIAATPAHLHRDNGHQLAKLANTVLATAEPDPERAAGLGPDSSQEMTHSPRQPHHRVTSIPALTGRGSKPSYRPGILDPYTFPATTGEGRTWARSTRFAART
ncbi:hypothetical protein [Krasilnikovia sp. MM14-A1259]|uniref:hypothetical protein n=1 Tax=Krasilnikovia sp. MM14-A1259 TaxID=3373539 RepID=UPI0038208751